MSRRSSPVIPVLFLVLASWLTGCANPASSPVPSPTIPSAQAVQPADAPSQEAMTPTVVITPTPPTPLARMRQLVTTMTRQEKAGQLLMLEWTAGAAPTETVTAQVAQFQVGGVLYLGNDWTPSTIVAANQALSGVATPRDIGRFTALDQEGGLVQRLHGEGTTTIPPASEQGTWSVEGLEAQAAFWGSELVANGISVNLAPVADTVPADMVATNEPIGALDRGFGADPAAVGQHAAAFIRGMNSQGILTTVKHFPGLGRVQSNTDFSSTGTVDDLTSAADPYLEAFRLALAAQPTMVMVSTATYTQLDPARQATFSPRIITDLLRGQLGWDGIVMADSMSAASVAAIPASQRAVDFVNAGGDLMSFGLTDELASAQQGLVDAMAQSAEFTTRVEQSVVRLLQAKYEAGLVTL